MKVMFACLADHASADQAGNKLNVNGIFDRIQANEFPARQPMMFLVFRLLFEHDDNNRQHKLSVTLRDSDHKEYQKLEAQIKSGETRAGEFVAINQIFQMSDVIFTKPGRYHFGIRANDEEEVQVPLLVVKG